MRLGAALGRKQREKCGTAQLGRALPPKMETALVTSGNDIPSTHPALGYRTGDLLWSWDRAELVLLPLSV